MTDDPNEPGQDPRPPGVRVTAPKCVRCAHPVQPRYRPFCSQRCAEIDLGSWFGERYRVATEEPLPEGEPEGVPRGVRED